MVRSLIPREERFYELFAAQAEVAVTASRTLHELMLNFHDPVAVGLQIRDLEHKGDEISHEIGSRLASTFVTPFDRDDIHDLNNALDDIVDTIEKTVDIFVLYRIDHPTDPATQLASIILQQTEALLEALQKLKDYKGIKGHWDEVHRLEAEGDRVSREGVAGLFAGTVDAIEVIKFKEVYQLLEACCDRCEDVADIIERIVAKHA